MFRSLNDRAYIVGGAVRDRLLRKECHDTDYVIEATEEQFKEVFPDAKRVGDHFPVYLHPVTGDEIALTREEKSNGNGYNAFEVTKVGVSIVEDLKRRDFSMNSIAIKFDTGELVDPYRGAHDIAHSIIRTINLDFIMDDPLRAYRAARFVSELNFNIHYNTAEIIRKHAHMIKHVTPDRVYVELKKVYERSPRPSLFFKTLLKLDILQIHFKPLYLMSKISAGPNKFHGGKTAFEHAMDAFDRAKLYCYSFDVALAGLFHDTGKGVSKKVAEGEEQHHYKHEIMSYAINKKFVEQHRFTAKQNELIVQFARHHMYFHLLEKIKNPIKLIRFYKKIRRHADEFMQAACTDHPLNEKQMDILSKIKTVFKTTVIEIPKSLVGTNRIEEYVESLYVDAYKKLVREENVSKDGDPR